MHLLPRLRARLALLSASVLLSLSSVAHASVITIAVKDGGFESLTAPGVNAQLNSHTTSSDSSPVQNLTYWTSATSGGNAGYNFVFNASTTTNSSGAFGAAYGRQYGNLSLWGNNGITASPDGGNFLALDGAFETGSVYQTLTGLTVGMDTKVYFYYAGAQQYGYDGATTEGVIVGLYDATANTVETHTSGILDNASHGFTGWHYTELDFVPTNTTETLGFLAIGTPGGVPPFTLLDGISVVQVTPEPSSLVLLGTGVLTMGGFLRRKYASR